MNGDFSQAVEVIREEHGVEQSNSNNGVRKLVDTYTKQMECVQRRDYREADTDAFFRNVSEVLFRI